MHGNHSQTPPGTFFDVSLGATILSRVDSSVDFLEVENIFSATSDDINFCVIRRNGDPYVSKLELRLLNDLDYSTGDPPSLTKVVVRVDVGNTERPIRYAFLKICYIYLGKHTVHAHKMLKFLFVGIDMI